MLPLFHSSCKYVNLIIELYYHIFVVLASSTSRKWGGKARRVLLEKVTRDGYRVLVKFCERRLRLVGICAKELTTEIGIICRTWAPTTIHKWANVSVEDKELIDQCILEKFDIDLTRPNVRRRVNEMLMLHHKDW